MHRPRPPRRSGGSGRPKSGRGRVRPISALRPSYWPRRTSASFSRSGRIAAPGIEIDRELEPLGDPGRERAGERDAVVHRGVAERHERDDVDRADARVLAGLRPCRSRRRRRRPPLERGATGVGVAGQGQHAPVVAGVARPVEEVDAGGRPTASARRSTTSGRRPSLKFGTDSTSRATRLTRIVTGRLPRTHRAGRGEAAPGPR